jgi:transcription antitermination factor NusG
MMDWFVACQEGRAINHLQEQGFKVYFPYIPKYDALKEESGRQALFSGYCFVESGGQSVSSIRSTPGVIALVSFGLGGKLPLGIADVLAEIRRLEAFYSEKSPGLQSGDLISLAGGPFQGLSRPLF